MAMNQDCVGRTYAEFSPFEVTPEAARAYAEATNANLDAYVGDDAVAPPQMGVVFSFGALGAPIADGDLNMDYMRMLHGEHTMEFAALVRPGDVIKSQSTVTSIDEKESGEVLNIAIESKNQHGDVVLNAKAGLFVRASRKRVKSEDVVDPFEAMPKLFSSDVVVAEDQSIRYAAASGDHNPIHTDKEVAALAGMPGVILHGLCSMAFVHNVLVAKLDGDPSRVKSLAVRFSRPVLMNDVLTVDVRGEESGPWHIRVENQDGIVVLKNALAEIR
ncbi:MAG: hypothetical protein GY822_32015 [Deltaproteobacteria bacterium]|nr:hypothetical protein [Deltaproteobacteria bacterium]